MSEWHELPVECRRCGRGIDQIAAWMGAICRVCGDELREEPDDLDREDE